MSDVERKASEWCVDHGGTEPCTCGMCELRAGCCAYDRAIVRKGETDESPSKAKRKGKKKKRKGKKKGKGR